MLEEDVLEYTVEEFRTDIFVLANENQQVADQLFEKFKENLIQELTAHANAVSIGKTHAQKILDRLKRNQDSHHRIKLAINLGDRPINTEAHHIVALRDIRAQRAREILREFNIDIDSKENGVYLPSFKCHTPHPDMPQAYAHRTVHTDAYYRSVNEMLGDIAIAEGVVREDIIDELDNIRQLLLEGEMKI